MAILDRRPPDIAPPRRLAMLRREADVREIGSATFRDTQPRVEPRSPQPVMSPATRRFLQAAEAGEGLHRGSPRKAVD